MLSLLVGIVCAAVGGDGPAKLAVGDALVVSDLFRDASAAFGKEADVLALFPLRRFDPAALAVR